MRYCISLAHYRMPTQNVTYQIYFETDEKIGPHSLHFRHLASQLFNFKVVTSHPEFQIGLDFQQRVKNILQVYRTATSLKVFFQESEATSYESSDSEEDDNQYFRDLSGRIWHLVQDGDVEFNTIAVMRAYLTYQKPPTHERIHYDPPR